MQILEENQSENWPWSNTCATAMTLTVKGENSECVHGEKLQGLISFPLPLYLQ